MMQFLQRLGWKNGFRIYSQMGSQQYKWLLEPKAIFFLASRIMSTSKHMANCFGCGVLLQSENPELKGYLPAQVLDEEIQRKREVEELEELPSLTKGELQKILKLKKRPYCICQRCHAMRYHNDKATARHFPKTSKLLGEIKMASNGIVVHIVDAVDFPGSLIRNLKSDIGDKPVIVVLNKVDLFPADMSLNTFRKYFARTFFKKAGFNDKEDAFLLFSAKTGEGVFELVELIKEKGQLYGVSPQNIYMVGVANVGKSSVINSLIKAGTGSDEAPFLTTSLVPGTTMDLLRAPLSAFGSLFQVKSSEKSIPASYIIDTPGVRSDSQITNFLTTHEVKMCLPTKQIVPRTKKPFLAEKSIFVGGMVRIDLVQVEWKGAKRPSWLPVNPNWPCCTFHFYGSKKIPIYMGSTAKSLEKYSTHVAKSEVLFYPPVSNDMSKFKSSPSRDERLANWPELELAKEIEITIPEEEEEGKNAKSQPKTDKKTSPLKSISSIDVTISGLGWATIEGPFRFIKLKIYTPQGVGIDVRPSQAKLIK